MTRNCLTSVLAVAWLGALCGGCGDDLPSITEIRGTQIVGMQVSVLDDPTRASPRPGEEADVRFSVVSPDGEVPGRRLRSAFVACTFPKAFTGIPFCQELIDLAQQLDPSELDVGPEALEPIRCTGNRRMPVPQLGGLEASCVFGEPEVRMRVPDGFTGERRLIRGIICDRGTPYVDPTLPELFACDLREGGKALLTHGWVRVSQGPEDDNDNPSFEDIRLSLNGRPWAALVSDEDLPEDNCKGMTDDTALLAADPFGHMLDIEIDADARERFEGRAEDLEFQLYATFGEVERRYTVFEGIDMGMGGVLRDSVPWTGPSASTVGNDGRIVRLYLAAFDRRGGFALATRHLCVFPAVPLR